MARGRPAAGGLRRGILAVCAIAATAAAHLSMDTRSQEDADGYALPSPAQARVSCWASAPWSPTIYWLQAMHLVGSLRGDVDAQEPRIASLIELVTGLDPWVDHPYRFAAIWLDDGVESVQRANRLLERAISYHPLDWRNRHYLGFNHFYRLDDQPRAAEVLEGAIGLEGAPNYLGPLVAKLRAEGGQPRRRRDAAGRAREHDARRVREGALPRSRSTRSRPSGARASSTRRASSTGNGTAATSPGWRICSSLPRPCSARCRPRIRTSRTSAGGWIRRPTRSPRPSTDRAIGSSTTRGTPSASSGSGEDANGAARGEGMSAAAPPIVRVEDIVKDFRPGLGLRSRRVLHGISFCGARGRDLRLRRSERRGQDHHAQDPDGPDPRRRGRRARPGPRRGRDRASAATSGFLPENPYFYDFSTGREILDFYARLCGRAARAAATRASTTLLAGWGSTAAADARLRTYARACSSGSASRRRWCTTPTWSSWTSR